MPSPAFQPASFDRMPGWDADDQLEAFAAFRRSAFQVLVKPYRSGSLGVAAGAFAEAQAASRAAGETQSPAAARAFFTRFFTPVNVRPESGASGLVTGFYEPEVEASAERTAEFGAPLLSRPTDLVDVDDGNRPAGLDPYLAFARDDGGRLVEYHDRAAIEQGALDGRGLEIAWLRDRVDAFFIHVQGCARLRYGDGRQSRITYAAKSGQRFTGPGGILVAAGDMSRETVSMQSIRAWLAANPARNDEILWRNRSYIFFREAAVDDPALGPVAAAKVPLTPGRSVAVDRLLHTFGTPFHIVAPALTGFGGVPFRRLMIAQDTGSAIVGAARGDLFAGSGDAAGEIAGRIRHDAEFYALLPNAIAQEFA